MCLQVCHLLVYIQCILALATVACYLVMGDTEYLVSIPRYFPQEALVSGTPSFPAEGIISVVYSLSILSSSFIFGQNK